MYITNNEINISADCGDDFDKCLVECLALAKRYEVTVIFRFNSNNYTITEYTDLSKVTIKSF